ncbi:protein SLC31A2-like isoform X2 [Symsagittifera roscoffensis]|uniref:protein SLC31A2-like isoform X2 n=1 Tax=Symsagittifera roscoffensis TaxID=84072 RepID=UPI00307BAFA2
MEMPGDGSSMHMTMHSMQMTFYGTDEVLILWESWKVKNWWQLLLSCVFWFGVSVGYEGLKAARERLTHHHEGPEKSLDDNGTPNNSTSSKNYTLGSQKPASGYFSNLLTKKHLLQTLLHFFQVAMGYLIMLVAMTFNVWLFVSIIMGFTTGYFFFGQWSKPRELNGEHCLP